MRHPLSTNLACKLVFLITLTSLPLVADHLRAADVPDWIDISLAVVPGEMPMMPGETPTTFTWSRTQVGDKYEVAISDFHFNAHTGTHIDAPIHLIPHGESVDQISFAKLVGPTRIIECSREAAVIDLKELNLHNWKGAKRLLFKTRNSYNNYWGTKEFHKDFTAFAPDAAQAMADAGVVLVGIDYHSVERFGLKQPDVHRIFMEKGIVIVESLDLRGVSAGDYDLIFLPVRFVGREAAPTRAIVRPRKGK